jgi:hypothetical protein
MTSSLKLRKNLNKTLDLYSITPMEDRETLLSFIGKPYETSKPEIERIFRPMTIRLCDDHYMRLKHYMNNTIRCVVKNGIITRLGFH